VNEAASMISNFGLIKVTTRAIYAFTCGGSVIDFIYLLVEGNISTSGFINHLGRAALQSAIQGLH